MGPPRGVVPGVAPVERMLARTDGVAISLGPFWVYPTGVEFQVFVDADGEWPDLDPFDGGRRRRRSGAGEAFRGRLSLGFQFSDGSKATTLDEGPGRFSGNSDVESPVLLRRGGSSTDGHWCQEYWLWPLPPPGRLDFVFQWPAAGIPLTRVELDAAEIAEAGSRSQAIFPDKREAPR